MKTTEQNILDFTLPERYLAHINDIAVELGVPTLREQLLVDNNGTFTADDTAYEATNNNTTFWHVLENIATAASVDSVDELDDTKFFYIPEDNTDDDNARIITNTTDYVVGRFGNAHIIFTRSTHAYSIYESVDDMTVAGVLVLACALKNSQHGNLLLLRYNDKAMVANRLFAGGSWDDNSTAKISGDMWRMFDGALINLRSPVLRMDTNEIVSLPFYKFRNLNECSDYMMDKITDKIKNAEYIEFTDKMDGSFVQMTYYPDVFGRTDNVLATTSGSIALQTNTHLRHLYQMIDDASDRHYAELVNDNKDKTFIFEMITDDDVDPHVVEYDESQYGLYLLAVRDKTTGKIARFSEVMDYARRYNLPVTKQFDNMNLDNAIDICSDGDPREREGFVMNVDGFLVKIKLDNFHAVSKLIHGSCSYNTVVNALFGGYLDDVLAKVPVSYRNDFSDLAEEITATDNNARLAIENIYLDCVNRFGEFAPDKMKDVANYIINDIGGRLGSFALMYYKNGQVHPDSYISKNPNAKSFAPLKENDYKDFKAEVKDYLNS